MSYSGTADQLAKRWEARVRLFSSAMNTAETIIEAQTMRTAIQLSSGPLSYAMLEAMGHPYAVRNPTSPNPEVINVHDGTVQRGWSLRVQRYNGGNAKFSLFNSSPWMPYLIGPMIKFRPVQIRRPIDTKLVELMGPLIFRVYGNVIRITIN